MFRSPIRRLWVGVTVELACVVLMTGHGNFQRAGEATRFTALAFAAGVAFWVAVTGFEQTRLSSRAGARWFWAVAVALRLAMLPIPPDDDLWRYRWEGTVQLHGFNPYELAPDAPALIHLRDEGWSQINHRNVAAIYPPLAELVFRWLARFCCTILGYKLLFACADLGVAGVLRRLLVRAGVSPETAAWFAWNPIVVYAGAGAAHFDSLMILFMLGAVWCLDRPRLEAGGSAWRTGIFDWVGAAMLGLAIALKAVPVVLLPVWTFALGWRRALLTLPIAVGLSPVLACVYGFPGVRVFDGLTRFAHGFQVNDAFWWLLDPTGRASAMYGGVAATVCLVLAFWFRSDWRRGTLWVLGAALLLSPAVHAWYALWVLPVAVWRGMTARAWVVCSISVFGYYLLWEVNHDSGRPWQEPLWLRATIYLPPLLAFGRGRFLYSPPPAKSEDSCYQ